MLPLVISRLLDGYGWSPLSTEFDYCALRRTLAEQYFAEEVDRAQALSGWKP
ncbi:MAG: hypothetical protein R3E96_10990 [Planctomycetota bacterium]